ncbi:DUF3040 domain-containing protein [Gordonia sp. VNK21]|uniref:DUF3040 domain-containing protein n=1 Tax=Gordonia sp. VNK21 TaxID=3382483 RepID=UPI0038D437A4
MPLSEHEQRMLDEIESALYAEDPKFASAVTKQRVGGVTTRRRIQAAALIVVGLALLVGGLMVDIEVGGLKIVSLVGFLLMFVGGLLLLIRPRAKQGAGGGAKPSGRSRPAADRGSFSSRMEERFNKRFHQDGF